MKNKVLISIAVFSIIIAISMAIKNRPITLVSEGLLIGYKIDDLIKSSQIIVIGEVKTILPSQWKDNNGKGSKEPSVNGIMQGQGLFTDSLISITQTIKGDYYAPIVRVRSFNGQIENIRWEDDTSPILDNKKTYLLFLKEDIGSTTMVDPGHYVPVGGFQGAYEIIDGKAISKHDEWALEDLLIYIQEVLSVPTQTPTEDITLTPTP